MLFSQIFADLRETCIVGFGRALRFELRDSRYFTDAGHPTFTDMR
jgi:hypothetical protein